MNLRPKNKLEQIHEDDLDEMDLIVAIGIAKYGKQWKKKVLSEKLDKKIIHQWNYRWDWILIGSSWQRDGFIPTLALMALSLTLRLFVLKRDASFNELDINGLKKQVERLKKEKEDNQFKIDNFENASKSLDELIGNQISDNNKKGLGYNVVPPPLTVVFAPPSIDLSNSGLEKFKQPEFEGYGVKVNKDVSENVSKEVKKNSDAPIIEDWISDCDEDETVVLESLNVQKPKQADQPRKVSQNPRNNSTSWNTPMPKKLGDGTTTYFEQCEKGNWSKGTVLTKYGLVPISTARENFSRIAAPVSAARPFNTVVHKPFVNIAKPRTNAFQKSHSSLRRPFCQQTTFKNRNLSNKVNTVKANYVNTAKGKRMTSAVGKQGINAVKPIAYWAWRPKIKMINHVYKNTGSCICYKKKDSWILGEDFDKNFDDRMDGLLVVFNSPCFTANSWLVQDQTVLALATPGQTATGKESSNPFMAGSLPKTINSNNVDEESQKIERQAPVMISDAEEYLISEDPVKQGRMERYIFEEVYRKIMLGANTARAEGSSRFHGDIQALLRRLDRQDLRQLYSLVQERFKDHPLEDGTSIQINMLVEKKYRLKKEILEKMINLKIEVEEESTMAHELIKFIKSQIAEQNLKVNHKFRGGLLGIKELLQDNAAEGLNTASSNS
ncbi:hypothetical protein Tco_0582831 [Tanacetum coccineum]